MAIGALMVLAAPFSLIDPEGFYSTLIKPSLIALWLSQLIVFAADPLFVRIEVVGLCPPGCWAPGPARSPSTGSSRACRRRRAEACSADPCPQRCSRSSRLTTPAAAPPGW